MPNKSEIPGFRIMGNLYFVGVKGFSSHLLASGSGHILLDAGMPGTAAAVLANIEGLGFSPREVRYILISHAHIDHIGGAQFLKHASGGKAAVCVHQADLQAAETGVPKEDNERSFQPVEVDQTLTDAQVIQTGAEAAVRVIHSPGHTPGCLSFSFRIMADSRAYDCMLFGGPGISYAKNKPEAWLAARQRLLQYIGTAEKLLALAPDVWLGAHPQFSQTFEKQHRLAAGESPNPFIDPQGWKDYMRGRLDYAGKLLAELNAAPNPA